jgi:hypothetical protein
MAILSQAGVYPNPEAGNLHQYAGVTAVPQVSASYSEYNKQGLYGAPGNSLEVAERECISYEGPYPEIPHPYLDPEKNAAASKEKNGAVTAGDSKETTNSTATGQQGTDSKESIPIAGGLKAAGDSSASISADANRAAQSLLAAAQKAGVAGAATTTTTVRKTTKSSKAPPSGCSSGSSSSSAHSGAKGTVQVAVFNSQARAGVPGVPTQGVAHGAGLAQPAGGVQNTVLSGQDAASIAAAAAFNSAKKDGMVLPPGLEQSVSQAAAAGLAAKVLGQVRE